MYYNTIQVYKELQILTIYIDQSQIEEYINQGWEVTYYKQYYAYGNRACFVASYQDKEIKMNKQIKIKHECTFCEGTGLYINFLKPDGIASKCIQCNGLGWRESIFKPFIKCKRKNLV